MDLVSWHIFLLAVVSTAALILGGSSYLVRKVYVTDHSSKLKWISIPLAVLGLGMLYCYGMELFISYYGANRYEPAEVSWLESRFPIIGRRYRYFFQVGVLVSTQLLWFRRFKSSGITLMIIGGLVLLFVV